MNFRRVVEMAPGLAGAQIDDDNTIAAFGGRVRNVGNAFTRCGDVGAEVEANIVEILCMSAFPITVNRDRSTYRDRISHCRRKEYSLKDGIVLKIDSDEFRSTENCWYVDSLRGRCSSSIQNPESVFRVYNHTLDPNKIVLVVGSSLEAGSAKISTTG